MGGGGVGVSGVGGSDLVRCGFWRLFVGGLVGVGDLDVGSMFYWVEWCVGSGILGGFWVDALAEMSEAYLGGMVCLDLSWEEWPVRSWECAGIGCGCGCGRGLGLLLGSVMGSGAYGGDVGCCWFSLDLSVSVGRGFRWGWDIGLSQVGIGVVRSGGVRDVAYLCIVLLGFGGVGGELWRGWGCVNLVGRLVWCTVGVDVVKLELTGVGEGVWVVDWVLMLGAGGVLAGRLGIGGSAWGGYDIGIW
ncbi:hypothetical protein Tco_0308300 [Tanacetum coccineum]